MELITDPDDPRVAAFRRLNEPAHRAQYERDHGVFVVEGALAIRHLVGSAYVPRMLLVTPKQHNALADAIDAIKPPQVLVAHQDVLNAIGGFNIHRGALALADRPQPRDPQEVLRASRLVAVTERVNDYENLGGLFRNARALGVDALLLDDETCDPLYRRCVRVSMGHVLHVPFARVELLPGGLDVLHTNGFTTVALTPRSDATPIASLRPEGRVAVVLGAEGPGLRDATIDACHVRVRIPMRDDVDSLNVATAGAIAFVEFSGRE